MGRYSRYGRYGGWGFFPPAPTVGERREKAAKTIARLSKKGVALSPVAIEGRTIARTFWGKAWCDNIEAYRDFDYRLERGRSYVRSGAVIDLQIQKGLVSALVIGSGRDPYEVTIRIDAMKKNDWDALVQRATGKISSLMALAQGKLPPEILEDFCNPETGLFPKPREIHFRCSCPDGASCCKHVAAVLYGIGARLDTTPELFFTLRGIDPDSIVSAEVVDTLTSGAENELDAADLGDVFGISLDAEADVPAALPEPKKTSAKSARSAKLATPVPPAVPVSGFPARLKALRTRLGLSQGALGKKLGSYQMAISLLERGLKAPDAKMLAAVAALEQTGG